MGVIQAHELFYSRVEAPFSTRNRSGYQVVYHSSALDSTSVREIENQVRCFEATQVSARYQYFRLASGAIALARSQEVDSVNTRITDRAGRPGPFLAHCLVLQPDVFASLDNNPLAIFDAEDAFVTDVEVMIAIQQKQPAARTLELEFTEAVPDYQSFDISGWDKSAFLRLWDLAADASDTLSRQRSVAVQTENEGTTDAFLRLLMTHLDKETRLICTFNTFVDGCEPLAGTYWMLGSRRRVKQPTAIRVHLDRRIVDYESPRPTPLIRDMAENLFLQMREAQGLEEA